MPISKRMQVIIFAVRTNRYNKPVLPLSEENIDDDAAIALAEALQYNSYITKLDLSKNFIRQWGAEALAKALANPKTETRITILDLSGNSIGNGAKFFATVPHLTELALEECDVHDDAAKALLVHPGLQKLNLASNLLTHNAIPDTLSSPTLSNLNLSQNKITGEAESSLARYKSPSLKIILRGNPIASAKSTSGTRSEVKISKDRSMDTPTSRSDGTEDDHLKAKEGKEEAENGNTNSLDRSTMPPPSDRAAERKIKIDEHPKYGHKGDHSRAHTAEAASESQIQSSGMVADSRDTQGDGRTSTAAPKRPPRGTGKFS